MDKANLAKVLAKLHFSSQLPESVLEKLAASAKVQKFPAGMVLFRESAHNELTNTGFRRFSPLRFEQKQVEAKARPAAPGAPPRCATHAVGPKLGRAASVRLAVAFAVRKAFASLSADQFDGLAQGLLG